MPPAAKLFEKSLDSHFLSIRKEVTQIFACKFLQKHLISESGAFAGGYIRVFGFECCAFGCIDIVYTSPEADQHPRLTSSAYPRRATRTFADRDEEEKRYLYRRNEHLVCRDRRPRLSVINDYRKPHFYRRDKQIMVGEGLAPPFTNAHRKPHLFNIRKRRN